MKRVWPHILLALSLTVGCSTWEQAVSDPGPAIFGGVRTLGLSSAFPSRRCEAPLWLGAALLDLPFVLAGDTLLLPVSIVNEIWAGGIDAEQGLPGY